MGEDSPRATSFVRHAYKHIFELTAFFFSLRSDVFSKCELCIMAYTDFNLNLVSFIYSFSHTDIFYIRMCLFKLQLKLIGNILCYLDGGSIIQVMKSQKVVSGR